METVFRVFIFGERDILEANKLVLPPCSHVLMIELDPRTEYVLLMFSLKEHANPACPFCILEDDLPLNLIALSHP